MVIFYRKLLVYWRVYWFTGAKRRKCIGMGVAGMISKLVMTGIIPENSLHLAPVSQK